MCGLSLLILVLLGGSDAYFGYRASLQHIEEVQQAKARAAAREIGSFFAAIEAELSQLASLPWGSPGFGTDEKRLEFLRLMRALPAITEVQAMDHLARERLSASQQKPGRVDTLLPVAGLTSAERSVHYGEVYFRDEQLPTVRLDVRDSQGWIAASIDLRLLGDVIKRLNDADGTVAYVMDKRGMLIAHPRITHVLGRKDLSRSDVARLIQNGTGQVEPNAVTALSTRDLADRPVIVTAAAVATPSWHVLIEQPRNAALKPLWETLARTFALIVFGGVAAVLGSIAFARRMTAPIVALRQATARIAAGDLQTEVPTDRHDEIQELAEDFNRMSARLRELYASLESKVTERTQELSDARDILQERAHEIDLLNQRLMTQLDELSLRKDEAERANAAKTRFLAAASHDLRQPMHSISLLIGVLRARLSDPGQIDLADKVQASVSTMENLFGNLLDISKLDAGAVHAHIEDVDLGWLLERAAHTWMPQAQEKGLSLRVRPGRWIVRGDATLLERIVGNLLANAIRYTRIGGVLVGCRRRGDHCELQIWDTGPGIAAEHREAIFEEFFRIGAPGTGQEKGLGLGLSIVRRCASLLGYGISVESREGRGSVFKVSLPLAASNRPTPMSDSQPDQLPLSLEGSFIVVVDDEATNREAVRDALLGAGCHVVAASGADDALKQLQDHLRTPDLILTDFQLGPDGNGLEVIQRLRGHYDEDVPALVVTANTDTGLGAKVTALGAGLLHKPVGLQRLLWAIKETLETA